MKDHAFKAINDCKWGGMRSDWIDSLKGIAIILVVVGHLTNVSSKLNQYIYSFHMPLFFFISGYLFNFDKYTDIGREYIIKKTKSLIIPYFFFSVISYVFYIIMDSLYQSQIQNIEVFREGLFFNLYILICSTSEYLINTPLWFLPCLFVTEVSFFALRKYFKHNYTLLFIIISSSFIGFLYHSYISVRLPWGADIAFTGIVFYSAGYVFRKNYEDDFFRKNYYLVYFLFLTHVTLSLVNSRVDMYHLSYNNYFLFYISAFSGILFYVYIFKTMKPLKTLIFYGKNSLIILGSHFLVISVLKYLLPLLFKFLNLEVNENIMTIIKIVLTLLLVIPFIVITNRHFPYIVGKKQNIGINE